MTETLITLINICTSIIDLKSKFFNSNRKKEIAQFLYEIGNNIETIATSLSNSEYPHQTCARMGYIAEVFPVILNGVITEREEEHLQKLLFSAVNIEKIFGEYVILKEENKTTYLKELHSISGSILGISDKLKYEK